MDLGLCYPECSQGDKGSLTKCIKDSQCVTVALEELGKILGFLNKGRYWENLSVFQDGDLWEALRWDEGGSPLALNPGNPSDYFCEGSSRRLEIEVPVKTMELEMKSPEAEMKVEENER